jgi:hypothetical protein
MQGNPKSPLLSTLAPKAKSTLVKLEREIAGVADRIRSGVDRAQTRLKSRPPLAKLSKAVKQRLTLIIALVSDYIVAIAASVRKFIRIAIRSGSPRAGRRSKLAPPTEKTIGRNRASHWANTTEYIFISLCLGLISISGILILVLFQQLNDMKAKAQQAEIELAATKAQLNRVEKLAQTHSAEERVPIKDAQPIHPRLSFSEPDIKAIRQFIKVLPPNPEAQQKIHLGDDIKGLAIAPLPDALIAQMPKLRGARFSIDEDGAIAIVGEGSSQVDAVLSYR